MDKRVDLHCHSTFSDGTLTPTELVQLAKQQGLSALALTDHNTSAGLKEFMEAGKDSGVITVPGCELSTEWKGKEIHIVGLFFREKYWAEVEDFVELMHIAKRNSNETLIKNLNNAG
ncbi:MAG: PHP domain-containing protein, partial [Erysipelotrichaceae bacterium]|nr:PHP domain-containing protein [Erysipelotrichaceae bacterium]